MLVHPGPADPQRVQVVPCRAHPLRLRLAPGLPLDRAVAEAIGAAGFDAAWLWLQDLRCARLSYVIPAPPPGDGRVAFYSDTHLLDDRPRIVAAGLHLGQGPAGAVLHAHGLWAEAEGALRMGHLRPEATLLAGAAEVTGWGLDGAAFHRARDAETGFDLFSPCALPRSHQGGLPSRLLRLRPHQDLGDSVRHLAGPQTRHVAGLGSLIGTSFADAPDLPGPATEILILGRDGQDLRIASVGIEGRVGQGLLAPANPVCITAELLLIDED
ncbi:DUF296 domain-containing protein (plasmid) [Paracoccus liaowanqingii]|uniref:DUF296 domain-containing protein n=1 Tax=Paracoccus liaowanqingii TaxID=2560053 RepID=A0A4Y5STX8_9RHOB|nr:DUF296 domain-containing protein [Paracoccus liaowanqingii]QDA36393.1 DUF296 domain-containing protein [Paracoccus liaowanqingii]